MTDGPAAVRGYWLTTGELQQWIAVPPEFGEAIEAAMSQAATPVAHGTRTAKLTGAMEEHSEDAGAAAYRPS